MAYITKSEFEALSETDRSEYYDKLREIRNEIFTAGDIEELAMAYGELGDYKNSLSHAKELSLIAQQQREADISYASEKRKKGFMIGAIVISGVVLLAAVLALLQMI